MRRNASCRDFAGYEMMDQIRESWGMKYPCE